MDILGDEFVFMRNLINQTGSIKLGQTGKIRAESFTLKLTLAGGFVI